MHGVKNLQYTGESFTRRMETSDALRSPTCPSPRSPPAVSTTIPAPLTPGPSTTASPPQRWPLPGAAVSAASQLRLLQALHAPDSSGSGCFEVGGPSVAGGQAPCSAREHSCPAPAYAGRLRSEVSVPPTSTISGLRSAPSTPRLLSTACIPPNSTINALQAAPSSHSLPPRGAGFARFGGPRLLGVAIGRLEETAACTARTSFGQAA